MYNAKSLKAEEFISDEEIRETLAYGRCQQGQCGTVDEDHREGKIKKRA